MKTYYYQWYDHLMLRNTKIETYVTQAILEHDWKTFYLFALMLNNLYKDDDDNQIIFLPKSIEVYDKENDTTAQIELTEETFKLIQDCGYECG